MAKVSFSTAINQGTTYLKNSANKLIQGFTAKNREGFDGILGDNNDMANVIGGEKTNTGTQMNNFNNNIAQYGTDYDALKTRTTLYLNNSENDYQLKKNYNLFINKSLNQDEIKATNQMGCVTATSTQASLNNIKEDPTFKTAYPKNFTKYEDAEVACKLWAADTNSPVYALNRNGKDFQCFTGSGITPKLQQYLKPNNLYTVVEGDSNTVKGGLFGNGQIGAYSGRPLNLTYNINAMNPPKLLYKFNNADYSNGPQPSVNERWWGVPSYGGWGYNIWPNDKSAWWLSTTDHTYVGTMGYFYYIYNSSRVRTVLIYAVIDDSAVLKINGTVINKIGIYGTGGCLYQATLAAGKNVFELQLINTGGPGAFVFYVAEWPGWDRKLLFTSSSSGWGYTSTPAYDHNIVTDTPIIKDNPYGMRTINPVPNDFTKCDPLIGGAINRDTISATFGRNCPGPMKDNYQKVYGNNGTVSCDTYCRGTGGRSWNNELPQSWGGATCAAAGVNNDQPCSQVKGSLTQCVCQKSPQTPWKWYWWRNW